MTAFESIAKQVKQHINKLQEENKLMKKLLRRTIDAHHQSSVDWDAMREIEKFLNKDNNK